MKRERARNKQGDKLLNAFPEVKKEEKTNDVQIEGTALAQNPNRYKLDLSADLDNAKELPTEGPIKESEQAIANKQNSL